MARRIVAERSLVERSSELVDQTGRERRLVRVDPDGTHPFHLQRPPGTITVGRLGRQCVEL